MRKRHQTKLVQEGQYVAEVDVELIDTGDSAEKEKPFSSPISVPLVSLVV